MAATSLAQMIVPEEFNDYVQNVSTEKNVLLTSGIATDMSAEIDAQLEGTTVNMPHFNDLDSELEDVVIDDTKDLAVDGITTGQDVAVKLMRAKAFGSTDLAGDLAGADPMAAIGNRYGTYWNRRDQRTMLSILAGAMGSAGMADNVNDISAGTAGAANFDVDSFIDSTFLLGDEAGGLTAVAVHSLTLKAMVKADLIDFVPDSQGKLTIPTYLGKTVLVDDSMPKSGTGVDTIFTTYIFGAGALGFGSRSPKNPVGVGRDELKGMGQEYIVHRRQFVYHPRGIRWIGTAAGPTPTNAELANPANWQRVFEAKQIRIVAFKHKLAA